MENSVADEVHLQDGDILTFGDVTVALSPDLEDSAGPATSTVTMASSEGAVLTVGGWSVPIGDPETYRVYGQLERLAPTDLSVLIRGETGTGKELAATALHVWSRRSGAPMVAINCAALPETLAESELFGHVRGAFSGAANNKVGLLESATGGTVFLDEIGDLSLAIQSKLLRVLETRRVTRLGSVRERTIDIRVVAATHRSLEKGVEEGWFRQDLFYRLNVALLSLPPLRARPAALALLAQRFLDDARAAIGEPPLPISEAAMRRMRAHDWPGNIRELKNLMEYLGVTVTEAAVDAPHVSARLAGDDGDDTGVVPLAPAASAPVQAPLQQGDGAWSRSLVETQREHERARIEAALAATGGNKTRAAKLLGIPLRTLMYKVRRQRGD